jgi:predicted nucleic acid-binding protein
MAAIVSWAGAHEVAARLSGRSLVAPRLMAYELANVAWVKVSRHPDQEVSITRAFERTLAEDFAITWFDVGYADVLRLAVRSKLTAYDASYLWLARHMQADLGPWTKSLRRPRAARPADSP